MIGPDVAAGREHAARMDAIYRHTRHVYDVSRKYFLFGRDRLLRAIEAEIEPGMRVCEVGCGTARNLLLLDRMLRRRLGPDHGVALHGFDVSRAMLATARRSIERRGASGRIELQQAFAESWDPSTFSTHEPFDVVFFSYCLSMIGPWRESIERALGQLREGGRVHIVDFWDQSRLPRLPREILRWWLALFHVHPRLEIFATLEAVARREGRELRVESVGRRYAFLVRL